LPVHVVTRTTEGLREIAIDERGGNLVESCRPLSRHVAEFLRAANVDIPVAARVEVGLAASQWMLEAARRLQRGFVLLFDYGHEPGAAHSATHPNGTLTSYRAHRREPGEWLTTPGERDLTASVDLAGLRRAAEAGGLLTLAVLDQTYFLLSVGLADRLETGHDRGAVGRRVAARTLMMPGGLGSTMKVMMFAKGVGAPPLRGTAPGRLT
jgi:SAM-dependent MidA family methyltransferase